MMENKFKLGELPNHVLREALSYLKSGELFDLRYINKAINEVARTLIIQTMVILNYKDKEYWNGYKEFIKSDGHKVKRLEMVPMMQFNMDYKHFSNIIELKLYLNFNEDLLFFLNLEQNEMKNLKIVKIQFCQAERYVNAKGEPRLIPIFTNVEEVYINCYVMRTAYFDFTLSFFNKTKLKVLELECTYLDAKLDSLKECQELTKLRLKGEARLAIQLDIELNLKNLKIFEYEGRTLFNFNTDTVKRVLIGTQLESFKFNETEGYHQLHDRFKKCFNSRNIQLNNLQKLSISIPEAFNPTQFQNLIKLTINANLCLELPIIMQFINNIKTISTLKLLNLKGEHFNFKELVEHNSKVKKLILKAININTEQFIILLNLFSNVKSIKLKNIVINPVGPNELNVGWKPNQVLFIVGNKLLNNLCENTFFIKYKEYIKYYSFLN